MGDIRERLDAGLLAECAEDHVGLWSVVRQVRRAYPGANPEEVGRLTLGLILRLIRKGMIQAGFPTEDGRGFRPWLLSPNQIVRRISKEWKDLGRDPDIGEVAWFTTADRDARLARAFIPVNESRRGRDA